MNKREYLRHKKVVNQIYEATNKTDLPYVSFANISRYLSSRKYLGKELSSETFNYYIKKLIQYGNPRNESVIHAFIWTLWENVESKGAATDRIERFRKIYNEILDEGKIDNILTELDLKRSKLYSIEKEANLKIHNDNMRKINSSSFKDILPNIGLGKLKSKILKAVNSNSYYKKFKISDIEGITRCYVMKFPFSEIEEKVKDLVLLSRSCFGIEMFYEIIGALRNDYTINLEVDKIIAIDNRLRENIKRLEEENEKRTCDELFINSSIESLASSYKTNLLSLQGEKKEIINDDISGYVKKYKDQKSR